MSSFVRRMVGMKVEAGIELPTRRLIVRTPRRGDGAGLVAYYSQNRDFLQRWSPTFRPEMFSERAWEDSFSVIHQQFRQGTAARFVLASADEIIGVANLTDIKASPLHSGLLGYTLSQTYEGQGYMKEALTAVLEFADADLNLHRVCANYMPRNERSGGLLRRLGFDVEGFARDYLLIDGQWEDHVMAARLNPHWDPESAL